MENPVKVVLKFFGYIWGKLLAVVCAAALMVLAFLTAMNTMNVQVMVKDAFTLRSSVMMKQSENEDVELIGRVFSEKYISENNLGALTDNMAYNVTNYNQNTEIELKLIWPWVDEVELTVTDVVEDVRATLVSQMVDASLLKENYLMDSGVYTVTVTKTDDGWIVTDAVMESIIEPEIIFPLPTPDADLVESEAADESLEEPEADTIEGEEAETETETAE